MHSGSQLTYLDIYILKIFSFFDEGFYHDFIGWAGFSWKKPWRIFAGTNYPVQHTHLKFNSELTPEKLAAQEERNRLPTIIFQHFGGVILQKHMQEGVAIASIGAQVPGVAGGDEMSPLRIND